MVEFTLDLVKAAIEDKKELGKLLSVHVPDDWPEPDYAEIFPFIAEQLEQDPATSKWSRLIIYLQDQ